MFRDVSAITQSDCIQLVSDDTLVSYDSFGVHTYILLGNKYTLTDSAPVSSPASTTECYSIQQAEELPSPYDGLTPFYNSMAIVAGLALFYIAYKIIIYPFFRRV